MADFEEKDKQLAFARAILQRIIARMHDAPDDHHEESVQAIYNGLVVAYERGARNENEAWVGLCNKLWLEADRKDPYCACIQATISMVGKAGRARMEGK
jgi:hypothetical protein